MYYPTSIKDRKIVNVKKSIASMINFRYAFSHLTYSSITPIDSGLNRMLGIKSTLVIVNFSYRNYIIKKYVLTQNKNNTSLFITVLNLK